MCFLSASTEATWHCPDKKLRLWVKGWVFRTLGSELRTVPKAHKDMSRPTECWILWFYCWEIYLWVDTRVVSSLSRDSSRGTLYLSFSGKQSGNHGAGTGRGKTRMRKVEPESCTLCQVPCRRLSFLSLWILLSALWCSYAHINKEPLFYGWNQLNTGKTVLKKLLSYNRLI